MWNPLKRFTKKKEPEPEASIENSWSIELGIDISHGDGVGTRSLTKNPIKLKVSATTKEKAIGKARKHVINKLDFPVMSANLNAE